MDFANPMGALAQLAQAQQQGTQRADAAYGALAGHLQDPMDRSGALMRMASGWLAPTRTGSFGESAGLAISGYADARDRMQDMDLARRKKLTEIEAARAKLGMQAAQNQFDIYQKGFGLHQGMQRQAAWDAFGQGTMPTDGAMTLNDVAPSGMGVPILSSSGFEADVIRPGADMPAQGGSPTGDLIPPVNEGSFFIPPGDTGQSRRIRQSEADMFGMPEGMDPRPAPGYSPFDDAGMMGTLPDRGAADRPAQGAGQRQASPQPQGRSRGDGFRVANDEIPELGSLMSPDMAMTPEQGRRFEAQPQARQAPAQGRQPQQAPQRQGLGFPRPQGVKGRAYDEVERLMNTPEGENLRRVDPEGWQKRYDRNWNQLKDTPEYKRAVSERQGRIEHLVRQGYSRRDATDLVEGVIEVIQDTDTGVPFRVNRITGEAERLRVRQRDDAGNEASNMLPEFPSLYDRAEAATGLAASAQEFSTDVIGQAPGIGQAFQYPDTVQARQAFSAATADLIRALSINPRFPVAEMERIREEIGIQPGAFQSAEGLKARMREVDSYLQRRLANERRTAQDLDLPRDTRQAAAQAANDITNFLAIMGVPKGGEGPPRSGSEVPRITTRSEWERLEPGSQYIDPEGNLRTKR